MLCDLVLVCFDVVIELWLQSFLSSDAVDIDTKHSLAVTSCKARAPFYQMLSLP